MFELSVACKYLRPRWRQLSVSIISLISILVIALVVWLIVVFFSVTNGLEKRWVEKLIALTAPLRITPTTDYYNSYYYQIDSISSHSNYTLKTIGEKWRAAKSDPYDPSSDEEIPSTWAKPDYNSDGSIKDPVKIAFSIVDGLKGYAGLKARDYEATASNLRLRLLRHTKEITPSLTQAFLSQSTYLGSLDNENPAVLKAVLPLSEADIGNLLYALSIGSNNIKEDNPNSADLVDPEILKRRLKNLFEHVMVTKLRTPLTGWTVPTHLLNDPSTPKRLGGDVLLNAAIVMDSLEKARNINKILFDVSFEQDAQQFAGRVSLGPLQIAQVKPQTHFLNPPESAPFWFYYVGNTPHDTKVYLPSDTDLGEGVLLPRPFRDAGVLLGDRGYISFSAPTASTMQEQRIKVFVAGFYDQGLIPIGGKFIP